MSQNDVWENEKKKCYEMSNGIESIFSDGVQLSIGHVCS